MTTQPMPMVQVFAPDGTLGDIPYDRLHDALGQGAKIAAKVKAPDGTVGFVPGDRVPDALKAGGQRVPLDMHDADGGKPGFWSQAGTKLKSQFPSVAGAATALAGGGGKAYDLAQTAITQGPGSAAWKLAQETPGVPQAMEFLRSRQAGNSVASSMLNATGTAVGVDPAQQEADARVGNTAGIAADAAVPAAETLLGYGAGLGTRALAGTATEALSQYKPQIVAGTEALQHPAAIPGKVLAKLAEAIPDSPAAAAAKLQAAQEAEGEQVVQAMKIQDPALRREALAKAKSAAAAAKADAAARQPVPLSNSPNYPKWKADQAAAAQAVKDA